MARECPDINKTETDQSSFWDSGKLNWDAHRIGWTVAGVCSVITVIISTVSVLQHCRSYTKPSEQRQILRILYMPPVYAIISFFSYRFFRSYTYYSLVEVAYEAVTLSAFLLLLIEYVAATASNRDAKNALARKDKRKLPMPLCCWRYRPTKAYFMYTVKWSVLQYVIIRPAASITGIICEKLGVLCEAAGFDAHWANVYIEAIDFVSISIALYGLLLFYGLTKEELSGRRPLAKFLAIKLIVMFTFYQSFVFSALEGKVIKATEFWTESNISNGLNALAICIEMIFFSALMWWAYNVREYKTPGGKPTSIWKPLWDSINYADFAMEIWGSIKFFIDYYRGVPTAHGHGHLSDRPNFAGAFGIASGSHYSKPSTRMAAGGSNGSSEYAPARARMSYDEDIRLAPYHYGDASTHNESTDESSIGRAH
ncbi:transmembrane protein 184c [Moniliophthora roreri MCA 2997]|uniref:Transmembrane protein 184c n=1 Tax=Moniliophthora roreri (strain MCA 2997) TaxID=1381753 RepID=V2YZC5_MONRO|nr:transmembrane protein 184c [Moniliophthora roreri MCA 2997]